MCVKMRYTRLGLSVQARGLGHEWGAREATVTGDVRSEAPWTTPPTSMYLWGRRFRAASAWVQHRLRGLSSRPRPRCLPATLQTNALVSGRPILIYQF